MKLPYHLYARWLLTGAAVIINSLSCIGLAQAEPGSPEDPVIIRNRTALEKIERTGHYRLGNDIDLGDRPWKPLFPNSGQGFSGTLDGDGFVLRNLNINDTYGARAAFIDYISDNSRVTLGFDKASVLVTNTNDETYIALGALIIQGNNNQLTLSVNRSRVEGEGSFISGIALLAAQVSTSSANNRLSLVNSVDNQVLFIRDSPLSNSEESSDEAALGLGVNFGRNTILVMRRVFNQTLDAATQYVAGAVGLNEDSQDGYIDIDQASDWIITSCYQGHSPRLALVQSYSITSSGTVISKHCSGETLYLGNNTLNEALALGRIGGGGAYAIQGTLLGVNTGPSGDALVASGGTNANCTGAAWDISRNGRNTTGCSEGGEGYYSHTPTGWQALWQHLQLAPDQRVDKEEQRFPLGASHLLITRQTYTNRLHKNGYYDEQGEFHEDGRGPLILRTLAWDSDQLALTFGTPMPLNITDDPQGVYPRNQTFLTFVNLEDNILGWLDVNPDTGETGSLNTLPIDGKVLAMNGDQLFTWLEGDNKVRLYRLNNQTFDDYLPGQGFNPVARFGVGLNDSLIQAEREGTTLTVSTVSFNNTNNTGSETVTINWEHQGFQLLAEAIPDDAGRQLVRVLPDTANRVAGRAVQIEEPEYAWLAYGHNYNVPEVNLTVPPVPEVMTRTRTFSQLTTVTSSIPISTPTRTKAMGASPTPAPDDSSRSGASTIATSSSLLMVGVMVAAMVAFLK